MTETSKRTGADRQRLIQIIKERSVETGREFKLASGRISDFYCNLKPTMLDPEGAHLLGHLIAEALDSSQAQMIGGLEMGAVPLATAAAAASFARGKPLPAFFVRKQAKDHGTQNLIDGLQRGDSLAGRRVVILEDVTTTGGSSMKAVDVVRAAGAIVAEVLTIVDRLEGAGATFKAAGVPFRALVTAAELR